MATLADMPVQRFAGSPILRCSGFDEEQYRLEGLDCSFIITEEAGVFHLLPTNQVCLREGQQRVARLEISHGYDGEDSFVLVLSSTSDSVIDIRNFIDKSIQCGRARHVHYHESCDLLHQMRVDIKVTVGSMEYSATFRVDLSEISKTDELPAPAPIVASSECPTQDDYQTPLAHSNTTSVVTETPFGLSRDVGAADDLDATPTKSKDMFAFPVSDVDTNAGSEQPAEKESEEIILQNVTNSAKRKAVSNSTEFPSTKRAKMVRTTYGRRHKKQSSLSNEVHADESTNSASEKENVVTKPKATEAKARKPKAKASAKRTSLHTENKKMIPPSQETSVSNASPRSAKGKLTIVFSGSSLATDKAAATFLKRNARILDAVTPQVDYLCIGGGSLKTTSKILKAVALGKPIISDEWVRQSLKKDAVLDPTKFLAQDECAEHQMEAPATWSHGTNPPRADLFGGRTVYMTPALRKSLGAGFNEIRGLVKLLGARDATSFPVNGGTDVKADKYVVLGLETGDEDGAGLFRSGVPVYSKDLVSVAILRGQLDLGDEFRFDAVQGKEGKRGKK